MWRILWAITKVVGKIGLGAFALYIAFSLGYHYAVYNEALRFVFGAGFEAGVESVMPTSEETLPL